MAVTLAKVLAYVRQPTTLTGLSTLASAGVGLLTGTLTLAGAVPLAVFALVLIAIPDNTAAQADAKALAADAVAVVEKGATAGTLEPAVKDAVKLVDDLAAKAAAVPPSVAHG